LAAAKGAKTVVLSYGSFLNTVVNLLIVSFAVFLLIKGINKLKRQEAVSPTPAPNVKDGLF